MTIYPRLRDESRSVVRDNRERIRMNKVPRV